MEIPSTKLHGQNEILTIDVQPLDRWQRTGVEERLYN